MLLNHSKFGNVYFKKGGRMGGNTLGKNLTVTTWGESHGVAVGAVIDGFPAGIEIDLNYLQYELSRRAPGQSNLTTPRKETDSLKILSGVFNDLTTGTPISLIIENSNVKSSDYDEMESLFRPGHADYTYSKKYGVRDHRGGGRSSARTTAAIVAAGAFCKTLLDKYNIEVKAYVKSVMNIETQIDPTVVTKEMIEANSVRCPDPETAKLMEELILKYKNEGDSVGGVIECVVSGLPAGLGEPVFDKFEADVAGAVMGLNACRGVEIGNGFACTKLPGSLNNDKFVLESGKISTESNNHGGVLGGITSGMPFIMRAAFKPTPTIGKPQTTINKDNNSVVLIGKGRHDPCVLPRAVPVLEALVAIVTLDHFIYDLYLDKPL